MGITDNLFTRKDHGPLKKVPRTVNMRSQQYRLANQTKNPPDSAPSTPPPPSTYRGKHLTSRANSGDQQGSTKWKSVTSFVIEEGGDAPIHTASTSRSLFTSPPLNEMYQRQVGYPMCVCYRDACSIACDNIHCHWTGVGRVRTRCPCHPTVTFLLDLPLCPRCLGSIRELRDLPTHDSK